MVISSTVRDGIQLVGLFLLELRAIKAANSHSLNVFVCLCANLYGTRLHNPHHLWHPTAHQACSGLLFCYFLCNSRSVCWPASSINLFIRRSAGSQFPVLLLPLLRESSAFSEQNFGKVHAEMKEAARMRHNWMNIVCPCFSFISDTDEKEREKDMDKKTVFFFKCESTFI